MSEEIDLGKIIVSVFGGGLLGILLKTAWDHFSKRDILLPAHKLIARLNNDEGLSKWGMWRVRRHLSYTVLDIAIKLQPIDSAETDIDWPQSFPAIVIRSPNVATLCPRNSSHHPMTDKRLTILYLRIENSEGKQFTDKEPVTHIRDQVLQRILSLLTVNEKIYLSLHRDGMAPDLYLWVDATSFIWSTSAVVGSSRDRLSEGLREKYPAVQLILEITTPADVARDLGVFYQPPATQSPTSFYSLGYAPEVQYVLTRDYLLQMLREGAAFRKDNDHRASVDLDIPDNILDPRFEEIWKLLGDDWFSLTIFGPAGSGKTQLARRLSEELCKSRHAIAIEVAVEEFPQGGLSAPESIAEPYPLNAVSAILSSRLLEHCHAGARPAIVRACQDVARLVVQFNEFTVVLICDDLDSFKDLREWLGRVRADVRNNGLNVKMIGVQRSEPVERGTQEDELQFGTALFSSSEATNILAHNGISSTLAVEEENLVERTPFAGAQGISLYGLRLIREWVRTSEATLASEVLRTIIQRIIAPLAVKMGHVVPHEDLIGAIERLRSLGTQENINGQDILAALPKAGKVDIIELLGNLAWHSKYSHETLMTADTVVAWSSGHIETKELATQLLREGKEAGIFRMGNMQSAKWQDQLVADGCAVMRLGSYSGEREGMLAEMAIKLVEGNASEMLWMASDHETFKRIVGALSRQSSPMRFLEKVLTQEAVNWLSQTTTDLSSVSNTLVKLGEHLRDPAEQVRLARLLSKLMDHDRELVRLLLESELPAAWEEIGTLTIAVRVQPDEFESEYAGAGAIPLLAAARVWPETEGCRLSNWYRRWIEGGGEFDVVRESCDQRSTKELLQFVVTTIRDSIKGGEADATYTRTGVREALQILGERGVTSESRQVLGNVMAKYISQLSQENLSHAVNSLVQSVRWVPEFVGLLWCLHKTKSFVVPMEASEFALADILSRIVEGKVAIPSRRDLDGCEGIAFSGEELVHDAMPKDFEQSVRNSPSAVKLYAGTARTWDGVRFSYVADRVKGEELSGRTRVRWRPKIELQQFGTT